MKRLNGFLGIGLLGLMLGVGSMSLAACGDDDDDDTNTTKGSGGSSGASGKGGTGGGTSGTAGGGSGTGGTAGGGSGNSGSAGSAGGGQTLTAYQRLGGKEGIRTFVTNEVTKTLADPILSTYFFRQVATPIPPNSPSGKQIIECFSRLVAVTVGENPEEYPGAAVNDPANTNTPNFTCRTDYKAMHAGLKIGDATFDAFVGVLGGDLSKLVAKDGEALVAGKISKAEYDAVANALIGTKNDVTDPGANIINDRNVKFEEQP
jgi:hypothetical protein